MLLSGGWTDYCTLRLGYFSIKTYISITLWRVFLLSNTNTNKNLKTDASDWNIPISKLKRKRKKEEEKKNKMLSSGGRSDYCTLRLGYFSIKTYISITLWRVFLLSNTNTNKNLKTDASDWNIPISKLKRKRKKEEEKKNKMLSSGGRSDYCTLRLGPPSSSALHSTVALSIYWWWNVNNLQWREGNIQIRT